MITIINNTENCCTDNQNDGQEKCSIPCPHDHDERYYTKPEIDEKLNIDLDSKLNVESINGNNSVIWEQVGESDLLMLEYDLTDESGSENNRAIATSGYVNRQSPIQSLNEGNGIGYRLRSANPLNYGNIGAGALDLSSSSEASSILGATGSNSFSQGFHTTSSGNYSVSLGFGSIASGVGSFASGQRGIASGHYSLAIGSDTESSGYLSAAFGQDNISNEFGVLTIGRFSTGGTAQSNWVSGSPIFKVGNGTTGIRSNAYILNNNGTSTQYGIASYGSDYTLSSDNQLTHKKYVDDAIASSGGIGTLQSVTDNGNNTDNVIQISGYSNMMPSVNSLNFAYVDPVSTGNVGVIKEGKTISQLTLSDNYIALSLDPQDSALEFVISSTNISPFSINGSMSGHNATLDNEFTTLGQLNEAISNVNVELGSGLYKDDEGKINLGLDLEALGTTNEGLLTEDLYLLKSTSGGFKPKGLIIDDNAQQRVELINTDELVNRTSITLHDSGKIELNRHSMHVGRNQGLSIDEDKMEFYDTNNLKGLVYANNYSANGILDDRWIPDYGAVKAYSDIQHTIIIDINLGDQDKIALNSRYPNAKLGQRWSNGISIDDVMNPSTSDTFYLVEYLGNGDWLVTICNENGTTTGLAGSGGG